jgi:hypothetical protein
MVSLHQRSAVEKGEYGHMVDVAEVVVERASDERLVRKVEVTGDWSATL